MLSERYGSRLGEILQAREEYRPHPPVTDRAAWEALPASLRQGVVQQGEKHLGFEWPSLPATVFMEYQRTGNRSHYESRHFPRRYGLTALVLAECVEDKGRFLDDIINGIWAICEESFWGISAHNYISKHVDAPLPDTAEPIIDLFAAETGALLAWTHYLLKPRLDAITPLVCARIEREVNWRILEPYLQRDDFWWMGAPGHRGRLNNWTPWCVSNCLTASLLLETDEQRRQQAVAKSMICLDRFLADYPADGGCDEGTSYWGRAGGSLFDCLELLYGASRGAINVYGEPLVADIGRYLYRAFISENWFVNFADGGAKVSIFADLVYRYGRRIGDPLLARLGAYAHQISKGTGLSPGSGLLRLLPALFNRAELSQAPDEPPYVRDAWLPETQFMAARQCEGTNRGLYLAAKGGHNAESHNHNDVGHFVVFADGKPVLIDVGVETYTKKTFSARRYEIWTMQSAYHNLPTVNGVQQQAGHQFRASDVCYQADERQAQLSLNIAGAYPASAGIKRWLRTLQLVRTGAGQVRITDSFALDRPAADIVLTLMTPWQPEMDGGVLRLNDAGIAITFANDALAATWEEISISDGKLQPVWGDKLYRIQLRSKSPVQEGTWEMSVQQTRE